MSTFLIRSATSQSKWLRCLLTKNVHPIQIMLSYAVLSKKKVINSCILTYSLYYYQLFINVSLWRYHVKLSSLNKLYRQPTSFFMYNSLYKQLIKYLELLWHLTTTVCINTRKLHTPVSLQQSNSCNCKEWGNIIRIWYIAIILPVVLHGCEARSLILREECSRLLSKNLKIKIYKTIILPVVLYVVKHGLLY